MLFRFVKSSDVQCVICYSSDFLTVLRFV